MIFAHPNFLNNIFEAIVRQGLHRSFSAMRLDHLVSAIGGLLYRCDAVDIILDAVDEVLDKSGGRLARSWANAMLNLRYEDLQGPKRARLV